MVCVKAAANPAGNGVTSESMAVGPSRVPLQADVPVGRGEFHLILFMRCVLLDAR